MKKLICIMLALLLCGCGAQKGASATQAPTQPPQTQPQTQPVDTSLRAQLGGEEVPFAPWEQAGLPTEGAWYLTQDVALESPVTVEGALKLHLNGHRITGMEGVSYGSYITVASGADLVIYDEADGLGAVVAIPSYGTAAPLRHLFRVEGTMTLAGGTVDAVEISLEDNDNGLCFYVAGGGALDITGGTVVGGTTWTTSLVHTPPEPEVVEGEETVEQPTEPTVQPTEPETQEPAYWQHSQEDANVLGKGGCVYVEAGGLCRMSGGTVQAGSAGLGGNFYIEGHPETPGKLVISGGLVDSGESVFHGGNIYCAGVLEITGGELVAGSAYGNGGNIFLSGILDMTGGSIREGRCDFGGLSGKRGGNILVNGKYAEVRIANAEIIDGDGHGAENFGGSICVMGQCAREFSVTDTVISGGQGHRGGNLYFGTLAKDVEMENLDFYMKNVTVSGGSASYRGANLCMDSDLRGIYVNLVMDNCSIVMEETSKETISLGAGAAVDTWATLTMNGGAIQGGSLNLYKDAVLTVTGTELTMDSHGGQGQLVIVEP